VAGLFGATLYWSVFRDGWGFLASGLFFFASLGWLLASLLILFMNRSKKTIYRILIIIAGMTLVIPMLRIGSLIRNQLFLENLAYYQAVVDRISAKAKETPNEPGVSRLPASFSSCLVGNFALIERDADSSFTLFFFTRDSSAIGHSGFLYRSDDNPKTVTREKPEVGLRRLAARWYVWGS
jgi:hypothetical protein